jgi:hypothetical protein
MAAKGSSRTFDPRRSEINRRNRQHWRGMSPEGKARVRAAVLLHRPFERSTGPRTPEGKARSARNGRVGREGPSVRELRAELAGILTLMNQMAVTRRSLLGREPQGRFNPPATPSDPASAARSSP